MWRREWIFGGGAIAVVLALALIWGLVRIDETGRPPTAQATAVPADAVDEPDATPALELARSEPDPAHDWLREKSLALVDGFLEDQAEDDPAARWREVATGEAQLIFAARSGQRFITLAAARVDCAAVDAVLLELADPLVGSPGTCARWVAHTRELLADRGIKRSPRAFLREKGVDTSVRIAIVYAGWRRTGSGPENFRLVRFSGVAVYPQSEFTVARRLALDSVMRDLGVGPYSETPIHLVTSLLRW